jgi:hypothetical protein
MIGLQNNFCLNGTTNFLVHQSVIIETVAACVTDSMVLTILTSYWHMELLEYFYFDLAELIDL